MKIEMPHPRLLVISCVLLLVPGGLFSQDGDRGASADARSRVEWESNRISVHVSASTVSGERRGPDAVFLAQQAMDRAFPRILFEELLTLPVDSLHTVEDLVRQRPQLTAALSSLADRADRGLPRPSPDLRRVDREYSLPLHPTVASLFVSHDTPFPMERVIEWIPTRDFTGVVIYAGDSMPLHGTDNRVRLQPALLPEIYDENLRPVLTQDMVDPAAIDRWGIVHYTRSTNADEWRGRVGSQPLRITARRAYGVLPTDIIIGRRDADRLLATEHNRRLLRDGRIVVILPSSTDPSRD